MTDLSLPKQNTSGEAVVLPMLIDGKWVEPRERDAVRSPFDGRVVSYQPRSTRSDLNAALDAAARAKSVIAGMAGFARK
jgi:acyl-CoA reductase-like NAD-dependent aldehyde dehydrogenase